ncbi:MAG: UDP-N-acetylmuramoyl-L-alanyl-D-glutamate--2,6-diaminopimelate ligase [Pseudomonadota bacterium]
MQVSALIKGIEGTVIEGAPDTEVNGIVCDSRKVARGSLFIAIPGLKADGHNYLAGAAGKGAAALVIQDGFKTETLPSGCCVIRVPDTRLALAHIAAAFHGHVTRELCLIGITGTNGKTTCSFLIESILKACGLSAGVIGTVNYRFNSEIRKAGFTTPDPLELQSLLRQMADKEVSHVVMEVSSHALDQDRVDFCEFDCALFTNLSRDHLDYHLDLEHYFRCKERLFTTILEASRAKKTRSVINADDPWGRKLMETQRGRLLTHGLESPGAHIAARNVSIGLDGIKAEIVTPGGTFSFQSPLLGKYNLYNILAASSVGIALGLPCEEIRRGIETLNGVPGRIERIENRHGATVLVDYAHTPDALENVLNTIKALNPNRIISVFGCGGNRDQGKRPLMGRIAAEYSQLAIVTSDNPRDEDPFGIMSQIEDGIKTSCVRKFQAAELMGNGCERGYAVIPDRREAIRLAARVAKPGDVVLIAGKGHEDYQIIKGNILPFDDRLEAKHAFGCM